MLIVGRKEGTGLWIGHDIYVAVHSIRGNQVRVRIDAPLTTPVYREELWSAEDALRHQPRSPVRDGLRIVVIDNENQYAATTRRILLTAGAVPIACLSSVEQIAEWTDAPDDEARRPDLLLIDTSMPGFDGAGLIGSLRAHPTLAEVPIVVFSRSCSYDFVDLCMSADASAVVEKPEMLPEAVAEIRRIVDFWSASLLRRRVERAKADTAPPLKPTVRIVKPPSIGTAPTDLRRRSA